VFHRRLTLAGCALSPQIRAVFHLAVTTLQLNRPKEALALFKEAAGLQEALNFDSSA
jgi:hypothetical protein